MLLKMKNCSLCPPGQRVLNFCDATHDTVCINCPDGMFSEEYSNNKFCSRCSTCKRKQKKIHACTRFNNTQCKCLDGYIYDRYGPCIKCEQGFTPVKNKCAKLVPPDPNKLRPRGGGGGDVNGGTSAGGNSNELTVLLVVIFLLFAIVVVVAVVFYMCYKKRANNDYIPPLPPKKGNYHSVNDYATQNTHVSRKIQPTVLYSSTFPSGLKSDLNVMLSRSENINYIHLADALNFSESLKKRLYFDSNPVETLLDYYLARKNPTKEELYEALIRIKHKHAAKIVWDQLTISKSMLI